LLEKLPQEKKSSDLILPLRLLLLKDGKREDYDYLNTFDAHLEVQVDNDSHLTHFLQSLKADPDWETTRENVVFPLSSIFSIDEVEKSEGLLFVNGMAMPCSNESGENDGGGRAFLPLTSYCSHDCVNNTFRTRVKDEKGRVILETRAKMDIKCEIWNN